MQASVCGSTWVHQSFDEVHTRTLVLKISPI
jgi:hypothetical protein